MKTIHWVALALALALGWAVFDGLRLRDKGSAIAGKYEEALTQERVNGEALTLQISESEAKVGQANAIIAEKDKAIGHLTNTIGQQDADLIELVQKMHRLEAVGDLPAQVANLKEQIDVWSGKFSLAQSVIAEKDAIISAWAAKYAAAIQIGEAWKAKYDAECRLLTLATQGWKVAEGKLRWTRVVGNVKSGIILAAIGYIGFKAIKGI